MNSIYTPIKKDNFSKIEEEFDYEILKIRSEFDIVKTLLNDKLTIRREGKK